MTEYICTNMKWIKNAGHIGKRHMYINYDGTLCFQLELYFLILKKWLQLNIYIYELGMCRKNKYRAKIFLKLRLSGGGGEVVVNYLAKYLKLFRLIETSEIKFDQAWSKKAREFQKNIYFCFSDYAEVFDCVDCNKFWKILQEMGIPDHLICLLRNLYAGQEATVRTGHGMTDWFQIGKGVHQGCILSPCLFNLHAEYIMRNAGLGEAQAGIKIAGRNINNLRYADDTTLMAESEELKRLLMKVKEEGEKVGLKLSIQKTKIMATSPVNSWQIDRETMETVRDFFGGLQNHCRWWLQPWNQKTLAPWKKSYH